MPVTVAVDSTGTSVHNTGPKEWSAKIESLKGIPLCRDNAVLRDAAKAGTQPANTRPDAPIGIFDSGVGGLSILRHIRAQLPHEHLVYVADSGFAPYGDKPEQSSPNARWPSTDFLLEHGAKALVVACNTATVAAIKAVRERLSGCRSSASNRA
jgi:hypothetical protein